MAYQPTTTGTSGGDKKTLTRDSETHELLEQILLELKKANVQLAMLMNSEVPAEDISISD